MCLNFTFIKGGKRSRRANNRYSSAEYSTNVNEPESPRDTPTSPKEALKSTKDKVPLFTKDIALVSTKDKAPLSTKDKAPLSTKDKAPLSTKDIAPVSAKDEEPRAKSSKERIQVLPMFLAEFFLRWSQSCIFLASKIRVWAFVAGYLIIKN